MYLESAYAPSWSLRRVFFFFFAHAFLRPRGTRGPCATKPTHYRVAGGRGVLARLREELVQLWPGPVTKVGGGRQLKQGGSESALCGDCEEPRPARYPGSDGGRA